MPSAGMCTAHAICCFSTPHSWCPLHCLCITTASQLFHSQMYMIVSATPEAKRIPSSAMVPRDTSRTPSLPASAMMACTCMLMLSRHGPDGMGAQHTLQVCQLGGLALAQGWSQTFFNSEFMMQQVASGQG